jgi:hypothetical protein
MDDIQRAEPGVRRVAVAIVGTTAIVGSFLIKVAPRYEPEFERWIRQAPTTRLVLAGLVLTALTTVRCSAWPPICGHWAGGPSGRDDTRRRAIG